jgi:Tol biopolymer transport system component
MVRLLFAAVILLVAACDSNKENTSVLIQYPDTEPAGDTARIFARGTISRDEWEHSAPIFSPDGKTVLWSTIELPSWKARIWEMNFVDGKWTTPQFASFIDTTANQVYPNFSPDGKILYFSSDRKLPSGVIPSTGNRLWMVEKNGTGWSSPQPLDSTISAGGDYATTVANNGNLYFIHGAFRSKDWNIFLSEKNGSTMNKPQPLAAINSEGYEDGVFVAPDESYLIFESDRPGGIDSSIDLYVSFKQDNGDWGEPVNMGPRINTAASERFSRVSPDGRYLFFGSKRRIVKGDTNFDIYWINASILDELRRKSKGQ